MIKRYYCDHCSKGMFKKPSMESHELSCIRNPFRACPLCNRKWDGKDTKERNDLLENSEICGHSSDREVPSEIRDHFEYCPACILSALVQFPQSKDPEEFMYFDFDYKKERGSWEYDKIFDRTPEF